MAEGISVSFIGAAGDYNDDDTFTIDVTASQDTYGDFFPGDNTNSLEMANLQYQNVTVSGATIIGSPEESMKINFQEQDIPYPCIMDLSQYVSLYCPSRWVFWWE